MLTAYRFSTQREKANSTSDLALGFGQAIRDSGDADESGRIIPQMNRIKFAPSMAR
jgi:hypothetical protein